MLLHKGPKAIIVLYEDVLSNQGTLLVNNVDGFHSTGRRVIFSTYKRESVSKKGTAFIPNGMEQPFATVSGS